jgi:hypothetical protein
MHVRTALSTEPREAPARSQTPSRMCLAKGRSHPGTRQIRPMRIPLATAVRLLQSAWMHRTRMVMHQLPELAELSTKAKTQLSESQSGRCVHSASEDPKCEHFEPSREPSA